MKPEVFLSKMSWPEVKKRLKETDIVLVPVGSTEQHGLHLPLDNDAFIASEIAKRVAEKVADEIKVVISPSIPFGVSTYHMGFPGTITLQPKTFASVVKEVCESLIRHGFRKIIIINGHGGNIASLSTALQEVREKTGAFLAVVIWWQLASDLISKVCETPLAHACEIETSVALAIGQTVNMKKARREMPESESRLREHGLIVPPKNLSKVTKTGVIGDSTKATKEKGEIILNSVVDKIAAFLKKVSKIQGTPK